MSVNNTQQATAAVDVTAVLDSSLNQVFTTARPVKATTKPTSKLMEHPLETGATRIDHRVFNPTDIELSMVLVGEEYRQVYQQIKDIWLRGDLLTVQTRTDSWPSMMIKDMPHEESPDLIDGVTLILILHEVMFTTAEFRDMKVKPKMAEAKNTSTVKRGEQRPTETPEPRKGSVLSKVGVFKK